MTMIQGCVQSEAQTVNMVAPVIPTAMMTVAKTFQLAGVDDTNISSRMVPMALVPVGATSAKAKAQALNDVAQQHAYINMMSTENQHITSTNATALAKSKGYVATSWGESTVQLKQFMPVLATWLGPSYHLLANYREGVVQYEHYRLAFQGFLEQQVGERLAPAPLATTRPVGAAANHFYEWCREAFA